MAGSQLEGGRPQPLEVLARGQLLVLAVVAVVVAAVAAAAYETKIRGTFGFVVVVAGAPDIPEEEDSSYAEGDNDAGNVAAVDSVPDDVEEMSSDVGDCCNDEAIEHEDAAETDDGVVTAAAVVHTVVDFADDEILVAVGVVASAALRR